MPRPVHLLAAQLAQPQLHQYPMHGGAVVLGHDGDGGHIAVAKPKEALPVENLKAPLFFFVATNHSLNREGHRARRASRKDFGGHIRLRAFNAAGDRCDRPVAGLPIGEPRVDGARECRHPGGDLDQRGGTRAALINVIGHRRGAGDRSAIGIGGNSAPGERCRGRSLCGGGAGKDEGKE
jgi:hypothetical protein